jgi:hypothetical protein
MDDVSASAAAHGKKHRLLDSVPEDRLADAIDMLRQWASRRLPPARLITHQGRLQVAPHPAESLAEDASAS